VNAVMGTVEPFSPPLALVAGRLTAVARGVEQIARFPPGLAPYLSRQWTPGQSA